MELITQLEAAIKNMIATEVARAIDAQLKVLIDTRLSAKLEAEIAPFVDDRIHFHHEHEFGEAFGRCMRTYEESNPKTNTMSSDEIENLMSTYISNHEEANAHGYTEDEIDLKFKMHERALGTAATKEWVGEQLDAAWSDRFESDCDRMISAHEEQEHCSEDLQDLIERGISKALDGTSFFAKAVRACIRDELTMTVTVD